jgi:hypothetical protein
MSAPADFFARVRAVGRRFLETFPASDLGTSFAILRVVRRLATALGLAAAFLVLAFAVLAADFVDFFMATLGIRRGEAPENFG